MNTDYTSYERKLANEFASTLKDWNSIVLHLQYVRKYKEEFLRRILNQVMSVPEHKIKKSRAALYTYLISRGSDYDDARH